MMKNGERTHLPHWLLVCGSGRNVGKSWFLEVILRRYASLFDIAALKVSPHAHHRLSGQVLLAKGSGYRLFRETIPSRHDSGRYLASGAKRSYYLECGDAHLREGLSSFMADTPENMPVLCESGRLGALIRPGLMIFLKEPGVELVSGKETMAGFADLLVQDREAVAETAARVEFMKGRWSLGG